MRLEADAWYERIAAANSDAERARHYDDWAPSYDADMLAAGYVNPAVAAALVSRHVAVGERLLDAGAGTGMLGAILKTVGYTDLVGIDISEGMLARARARDAYAELRIACLGERLPFPDGAFGAVVAFGVLAFGHADHGAFDELIRVTRPSGHVIFNVNFVPWRGGFKGRVDALAAAGRWTRVASSAPYLTAPLSSASSGTSRAFVYRVSTARPAMNDATSEGSVPRPKPAS